MDRSDEAPSKRRLTKSTLSRASDENPPPVPPKPKHLWPRISNRDHTDLKAKSPPGNSPEGARGPAIAVQDTRNLAATSLGLNSDVGAGKGKGRATRCDDLPEGVEHGPKTVADTAAVQNIRETKATLGTKDHAHDRNEKGRFARRYGLLPVVDPGAEAVLDILCIHGLNGDALGTWTFKGEQGDVFWLKDCLPTHLPNARILTYGYDGETEGVRPLSHQSIQDIAETFVTKLTRFRLESSTQKRPLILIGHSVGGIVLKRALVHSSMANRKHNWSHRSIHDYTAGIIFMGTPHQGADGAPWHEILPSIASIFATGLNVREMDGLCRDSHVLQDLSASFTAIAERYSRKYIYETQPSQLRQGGQSVIVPKSSAVVHHANAEVLSRHTDHLGLAKFESEDDDDFKDVVSFIRNMLKEKLSSSSVAQQEVATSSRVTVDVTHSEAPPNTATYEETAKIPSPSRPMSSSALYTWHIIQKQIGFPLWCPSPFDDAPSEYRRVGVEIGDVGCIIEGAFDYLFNVCKPADDPVNCGRVPPSFTHLSLSDLDIRRQSKRHPRRSQHLSSTSLWCERCIIDGHDVAHDLAGEGFHYIASGKEGALLVLPEGADFQELRSLRKMERHVRDQCRSWFTYMDERGIPAPHLCIVTATDKTCSWGVASVHASPDSCTSFRFACSQVNPTGGGSQWSCRPPIEARASEENIIQNQCVFIRGFNLSRTRDKVPLKEESIQIALLDGTILEGYHGELNIGSASLTDAAAGPPAPAQGQNTDQGSSRRMSEPHLISHSSVEIDDSPTIESLMLQPETLHPGHILNDLIMQAKGQAAEITISHDDDWCNFKPSALQALLSDFSGESASSRKVIQEDSNVVIEQGIASLKKRAQVISSSLPIPTNSSATSFQHHVIAVENQGNDRQNFRIDVVNTAAEAHDTKEPTDLVGLKRDRGKGKGRSARRYGVLKVVDPGPDSFVDILCIHGLNGDAFGTWTFEGEHGDVCWLDDFLPKYLSEARILTYGYDGATDGSRPLSNQSIQDIAETFVTKLTLFRASSGTQRRPIVFIAHSVGGIVLKHALVNSSMASVEHNLRHRSLHESTVGIIFMGTPHQGADGAPWHAMLPSLYSILTTKPNIRELNDLCRDSVTLQDLSSRFTAIAGKYQRKYIYETRASQLREGGWSVIVPRASAMVVHLNYEALARHTDHLGLARFESEDDDDFRDIVCFLQAMVEGLPVHDSQQSDITVKTSQISSTARTESFAGADAASISVPHRPMSSCSIYMWHLIQKQIGYPLWDPSPPCDAPSEYRQVGVEIGDVGRIIEGAFDYHFNICKPADHPVNRGRVPLPFTHLPLSGLDIRRQTKRHPKKSQYLSSKALWCERCTVGGCEVIHDLTTDGFHYVTADAEGALLVLPKGSDFQELRTLDRMERHVREHSKTWFAYMDDHGIPAPDLCLVTATDKTCSWGVAAFHASPDTLSSFRFSCSQLAPAESVSQWDYRHPVDARASDDNAIENQCVLLRGFTLSRSMEGGQHKKATIRVGLLAGTSQEGYYRNLALDTHPADAKPPTQGSAGTSGSSIARATTRGELSTTPLQQAAEGPQLR